MEKIAALERQLRAVGSRRRLQILMQLKRNRSMFVGDIAHAVKSTIRNTSQHLRVLRAAGIVEYTKRGVYVSYRISLDQEEPVRVVLRML